MSTPGSITTDDVAKVASLARLRLDADELERFTHQLADILGHAADLDALDLDHVAPMAHPIPMVNVLRADVPGDLIGRDEALAQAPAAEDGQFRVPPVLGEAP